MSLFRKFKYNPTGQEQWKIVKAVFVFNADFRDRLIQGIKDKIAEIFPGSTLNTWVQNDVNTDGDELIFNIGLTIKSSTGKVLPKILKDLQITK